MKLPQSIQTFFKSLPLNSMRGEDLFVAIVFFLVAGNKYIEIRIDEVQKGWSKSTLGKTYNSSFAYRAKGRVHSPSTGKICLTDEGIDYVESLLPDSIPKTGSHLIVFEKGATHSFDKFIRSIFNSAVSSVDIVDTYVSGNLFDHLLDEIPATVPIQFLYMSDTGGFVTRSTRFSVEYNFQTKQSNKFHDRFLIIDGHGYIIGPSLKDAADKKPATVVVLSNQDSQKLTKLFSDLWR